MNNANTTDTKLMECLIAKSLETILNAAHETKNDPITLLDILRKLECLHKEIRDTLFQQSLPDNRQALYVLLRDIETTGGWPYIYRPKLWQLMERLPQAEQEQILGEELPPS